MRQPTDRELVEVIGQVASNYTGDVDPELVTWLFGLTRTLRDDGRASGDPLGFVQLVLEGVGGHPGMLEPHVRNVEEQLGEKVACQAGCAACCDYTVSAIGIEADRIAARVMLMPEDERRGILARVREAKERGLDQLTPLARLAERFACPLLVAGQCSVYSDRPIACRAWFGTDPERCASVTESSPFGLLALMGDCASFAVDLAAEDSTHEAGDLITLLAERFNV